MKKNSFIYTTLFIFFCISAFLSLRSNSNTLLESQERLSFPKKDSSPSRSNRAEQKLNKNLTIGKVFKVVDGDTIKVRINDMIESVRLIGIDAPEKVDNEKAHRQDFSNYMEYKKQNSPEFREKYYNRDIKRQFQDVNTVLKLGGLSFQFLKTVVKPGDTVYLEEDVERRDKFGRLLAYVYLSSSNNAASPMLNDLILKKGYAKLLTIPPNIKYIDQFKASFKQAQSERIGLWK
jgi:micrococcal nuclease